VFWNIKSSFIEILLEIFLIEIEIESTIKQVIMKVDWILLFFLAKRLETNSGRIKSRVGKHLCKD
jgi:hypothetical protein